MAFTIPQYEYCLGKAEETTTLNNETNFDVKTVKSTYCSRRNTCWLYRNETKRRLLAPTLSMVEGNCSFYIEDDEYNR